MASGKDRGGPPPGKFGRVLFWPVRFVVKLLGWITLALLVCAFTQIPWHVYEWLGNGGEPPKDAPDYIVVMGGGGIPSESGLMRTYDGAQTAAKFPAAKVVVAMPGDPAATNSAVGKMRDELAMRGVARPRIMFEDKGLDTHEQAVNCFKLLCTPERRQPEVMIVTSPEHMKRCLLSFRKAGFTNVCGNAAYDVAVDVDLRFKTPELEKKHVPDVGESLLIRYRLWTNLELEMRIFHELAGLAYYKLLGWI